VEQTGGGKTIFTEPVLVVNQKAKDIEINNEYSISTPEGTRLASVRQVGQSIFKKAFRFISDWDSDLRHTLQILDLQGDVVLELTRPSIVVKLKSQVIVREGAGNEIGRIVQQKAFSDGCSLESGGTPCGSVVELADGDADYSIRDLTGTEVACVTETFDESKLRQLAKILFTTANSYLVEIHRPLDDPLRSLVVASALAIDLAFEQI
jgi:uncharacterized protein YxjI